MPAVRGALLLGVMTSSGRLAYLNPSVPVDAGFTAREAARGTPNAGTGSPARACPLIVADMSGTDTYQSVRAEAYDHDPDTQQIPPPSRQ